MKNILNRLIQHEVLSRQESKDILVGIANKAYNESEIASFLTVYMMRSIQLEELEGFRDALLELCLAVDLSAYEPIDLCGTGGDGKDTFNISTLASFVTAANGVKVTKHGNYGVSSSCGSSNVMEALGIKFTNDKDYLEKALDQVGICVLHAPLFHPAMKQVAPIRKALGVKTFFNMLGPMVNPAFPTHQMVGVFNLELARIYGYLYQKTDKNYSIVHALDGYDEVSLTGATKIITRENEMVLDPSSFGVNTLQAHEIAGGESVPSAAAIFVDILSGKGTDAQNNVVCANAAVAINTVKNKGILTAFEQAKETLLSGAALKKLQQLQAL
ncbi:anthranilate phosphoribosyltransferase [Flavobacteria bacterium MS024-3C]|jgi:anthranilate phosphoribosyltransferase|nr:anthranilate phosphoribosyltransferase [Flavobacteria bacterium MS024-3C]MDA9273835.1 anthranilate phosphoribosyltransferase [Flavobacteriaceae bacterium]MDB9730607.1 anthranilate phosphoribosyltransferase [Flavobacteriaceae bacterium]NQV63647.1 anthranilate phosphoribosyltransferase [Cryomorphaceae bacterium]|tara:strand:+ start:3389 stop:4375 length:987 start_codon:yes stop_codon:yes gene_type:complete